MLTREAIQQNSKVKRFINPTKIKPTNPSIKGPFALDKMGIYLYNATQVQAKSSLLYGMDSIQQPVTTPSIAVPIQFIQEWLPGWVHIITRARKIDELVGISLVSQWHMAEIVIRSLELLNAAIPYGDYTNVPLTSWNPNYNYYSNIQFEEGFMTSVMEALRAAEVQLDDQAAKRDSVILALEISRNLVGFFGYNNGSNNTYGFLNFPGLPSYHNVPAGAGGFTQWATKTTLEIISDIQTAASSLRTSSGNNVDPMSTALTLALSDAVVDYVTTPTTLGYSVKEWIAENYGGIRIVSASELTAANGGANVGYLFADQINDSSTDDRRVFDQYVATKLFSVGVQQLAKGYLEDFSNATFGVVCKRPYAVNRFSGI